MNRKTLLLVAVFTEGGLFILGLLLVRFSQPNLWSGFDLSLTATCYALLLSIPLFGMLFLTVSLHWEPLSRLRYELDKKIRPVFSTSKLPDLLLIALLAGVGEELFFRGWLQNILAIKLGVWPGILLASAIFGLVHYLSSTYAVYAFLTGLYLGLIYQASGNLYIVMLIHGLYDFIALLYLIGRSGKMEIQAGKDLETNKEVPERKSPNMIPKKLTSGDELRVVAPSLSLGIISDETREIALRNLAGLNLKVSFGDHCEESDELNSSSIESRIADLHEAFADPNVKGILPVIGGFNSNQLLRYLDYDLIRANPKVFCGFSDITALSLAIYARTGLVTYSGPFFSTFGMAKGLEYSIEYFKKCLLSAEAFTVESSKDWSDDRWYQDQEDRNFIPNEGYLILNEGKAEGKLLGGNLCTMNLLQGTEYMPSLVDSILLLEDDHESNPVTFDRDLQSLIHQPNFEKVKGLVIGRFQKASEMDREKLEKIIRTKRELASIPVIANADFGHTTPQFTFPIGGKGRLGVAAREVSFIIDEH